jgi:Mrp family chromosome partitioning ATPase
MGKHTAVLEKAAPQVTLFSATSFDSAASSVAPIEDVYIQLASSLFGGSSPRTVIAFASAQRGEGVTYIVQGLAAALSRSGNSVAVLDSDLRPVQFAGLPMPSEDFGARGSIVGTPFLAEAKSASQVIAGFRNHYDRIVLDCGSMEASSSLMRLGPVSDGVVIVAEAGKVSKRHMDRAAQVVRQAEGTLIGIVLNKRRYPIPAWLYRML